jgi:hypothetical protein
MKGRDHHLKVLGIVEGNIKMDLKDVGCGLDSSSDWSCNHGNESSSSMKDEEFLD